MEFVYIDDDGAVIGSGSGMTQAEADQSIAGMGSAIALPEGQDMPSEGSYWDGQSFLPLPSIPMPVPDEYGYRLTFADPPSGLTVRVYDGEIDPPHLLYDGPLSAPDCSLRFIEPSAYRVEFKAAFPFQPVALSFTTPITGPLDA